MLSFLINANTADDKLIERHTEFIKKVTQIEANFEVIFLARQNFPQLNLLKVTASQVPNHNLVICSKRSNDNEMIEIGLKIADSNDVLICTLDTSPDTIYRMLEKRKEGKKIVYVKKKSNKFVQFFRSLGTLTYNIGLTMIGKARDNFSEVSVQYLDGRVVNSLNMNSGKTRELRISNTYKQLDTAVLEEDELYQQENKKGYKERVMYSTGWVATMYLLAFLAMAIIYPFFNNFIYSWWIAVALVVWILLGIAFMVYFAKLLFKQRAGQPIPLDQDGQPLFRIVDMVEFGDKITFPADPQAITAPLIKSGNVKIIKPERKPAVVSKGAEQNIADANLKKAKITKASKEKVRKQPKKIKKETTPKPTVKIEQKTNKITPKTKRPLTKTDKGSKAIVKATKTSKPVAKSDENKIAPEATTSKPAPIKTKAKASNKAKN